MKKVHPGGGGFLTFLILLCTRQSILGFNPKLLDASRNKKICQITELSNFELDSM